MKVAEQSLLRERVFRMLEGQHSKSEVARHFFAEGHKKSTIYNMIARFHAGGSITNNKKPGRRSRMGTAIKRTVLEAAAKNETGVSTRQLAKQFDMSQSTVARILRMKDVQGQYKEEEQLPEFGFSTNEEPLYTDSIKSECSAGIEDVSTEAEDKQRLADPSNLVLPVESNGIKTETQADDTMQCGEEYVNNAPDDTSCKYHHLNAVKVPESFGIKTETQADDTMQCREEYVNNAPDDTSCKDHHLNAVKVPEGNFLIKFLKSEPTDSDDYDEPAQISSTSCNDFTTDAQCSSIKTEIEFTEATIPEEPKVRCKFCQKQFESETDRFEHHKICIHNKSMPLSNKKLHLMLIKRPYFVDDGKYMCSYCRELNPYASMDSLSVHQVNFHGVFDDAFCRKTPDGSLIDQPQMEHHCEGCGYWFLFKKLLDHHECGIPKILRCNLCRASFRLKCSLMMHQKTHKAQKKSNEQDGSGSNDDEFFCDLCDRKFFDKKSLTAHKTTSHDNELERKQRIKCEYCSSWLATAQSLEVHYTICSRRNKYQCKISKANSISKDLENCYGHESGQLESLDYLCDICTIRFTSAGLLEAHKLSVHYQKPLYRCTLCDKTFHNTSACFGHRKMDHADELRRANKPLHRFAFIEKISYAE
ncbi:zinc finger protein 226-like [Uranotaenia lowii]|uniref:zinc finger protein 226-like n=1 Tax=Uranotaenia lowii TaxID=190385 RepID=UPI00247ACC70|nr:zinc finger protein 226-like [Uranotaenia lowii]